MENSEQSLLEGFLSVQAVLMAESREIIKISIDKEKQDGQRRRLEQLARAQKITLTQLAREEIDAVAGGRTHGGVIALAGPRRLLTLDELFAQSKPGWHVMLDGVEDPFNFGAAVRSLHAAGAAGLIVRPRNWLSAGAVVARSSAGATELMPTASAETAQEAADFFSARGCQIACASEAAPNISLFEADLTRPLFLLIGGEKRGITRSFETRADLRLRIPYAAPQAYSLGTAASAAVIGFEILRQRTASLGSQK